MTIHVAITGASGTIYAARLISKLSDITTVSHIFLTLTHTAQKVTIYELSQQQLDQLTTLPKVKLLDNNDYFTSIASGSSAPDAMVILPASMGMIARIANGISNDLISRSADVMLKEERKIIISPRETPLSLIHLENLVKLKKAGATILPATPSFYSKPQNIEQVVDTVVERIIDHLHLPQQKFSW